MATKQREQIFLIARVSREEKQAAKQAAKRERVSFGEFIRRAVSVSVAISQMAKDSK